MTDAPRTKPEIPAYMMRPDMLKDPPPPIPFPAPLRCLADFPDAPPEWLWPGRVACGALTLLIGAAGQGKSLLTLDMAARVSAGLSWPDEGPAQPPGDVIVLSAEDSPTRTVRARLSALGANLRRVHILNSGLWSKPTSSEPPPGFTSIYAATTFGHIPHRASIALRRDAQNLKASVQALSGCRLVVIDPILSYLNDLSKYSLEEARVDLAPLATLADVSNVAIVAVAHRDYLTGQRSDGRYASMRALFDLARSIHLIDRHPCDPFKRVLTSVKNNLAEPPRTLTFEVASQGDSAPRLAWSADETDVTAEELLAGVAQRQQGAPRRLTEIDRAAAWLEGALAAGPVPSRELVARAQAAGIANRLLKRARERLGVLTTKHGAEAGCWICNLPPNSQKMEGGQLSSMVPLSPLVPFPDEASAAMKPHADVDDENEAILNRARADAAEDEQTLSRRAAG
jgi:putative DNA primase/helicase